MADSDDWFVSEDGCISIGQPSKAVAYHPNLNAILVTTKEPALRILDVTSGSLLQTSSLSADVADEVKTAYFPAKDRVVFGSSHAVGTRRDLNGILLLDTALQTPVTKSDDVVAIELPLPEATHLFKALVEAELSGVDYVEEVMKELEKEVVRVQNLAKQNHKVAKWACVCLKLPHCALKAVCSGLVSELRPQKNVPGLSVASSVIDRLGYLLPSNQLENVAGQVDRTLMYSEAARLETFLKWPHMNYKWALPDPMAQAGFYHQPSSAGDDRAMCFTCNVCLVCWEPTDEPWSEHERHSPTCPFVKGEYTQNVPMSITYATEPAQLHGAPSDLIECISATSSDEFFATSGLHGDVVVWSMKQLLQKHIEFNIDPWEPVIAGKMGSCGWTMQPTWEEPQPTTLPSEELAPPDIDAEHSPSVEDVLLSSAPVPNGLLEGDSESKTEIIEVGGAWKKPSSEIPLQDFEPAPEPFQRCRPSQDVLVSSLCLLGALKHDDKCKVDAVPGRAALVSGLTIRHSTVSVTDIHCDDNQSEVQAMNEVNQAISSAGSPPQIIADHLSPNPCSLRFETYLLVHDFGHKPSCNQKRRAPVTPVTKPPPAGDTNKSTPLTTQDLKEAYIPMPSMEIAEDPDPDVQIIGFTPPPGEESPNPEFGFQVQKLPSPAPNSKFSTLAQKCTSMKVRPKSCKVVQCLQLPLELGSHQYISHIVPSHDLVMVVTAHRMYHEKLSSMCNDVDGQGPANEAVTQGALLLYKAQPEFGLMTLEEKPRVVCVLETGKDRVVSVSMLPAEMNCTPEDEDSTPDDPQLKASPVHGGQMAVATAAGEVKVIELNSLLVKAVIKPPEGSKFVCACYCAGIDRLCCLSEEGKLHFYIIGPHEWHVDDVDFNAASLDVSFPKSVGPGEDAIDGAPSATVPGDSPRFDDLLVQQPLTSDVLSMLHDLTRFENLVPRFSATVPPCWSEIQQEQQQRRHPQHLHQHGEATQHTRTWRLQPDNTSWEEHLIELVLPRPTCVGHIDLKFMLHPMCTSLPHIQVTLLKQSISNIGRIISLSSEESKGNDGKEFCENSADEDKMFSQNVLPEFLEKNFARVICGPVDLVNFVEFSGDSGVVTLTSPQLLKVKSKSFLIHLKALPSKKKQATKKEKSSASNSRDMKHTKSFPVQVAPSAGSAVEQAASKQKLENIKGCDWLQEISVTIRRSSKSSVPQDRLQRYAMLESSPFHGQLVQIACGVNDGECEHGMEEEYRQRIALTILTWIIAIHMNTVNNRSDCCSCPISSELIGYCRTEENSILLTIQAHLQPLVMGCFMQSGRSMAHQASRLISLCIEYAKNLPDGTVAPAFIMALLHALLECLPHVESAKSAGSLHWFFILLNSVKSLDSGATGQKCADVLLQVAKHHSKRANHQHTILRSRFGLYGCPLDPELFDIDQAGDFPKSADTSSSLSANTCNAPQSNITSIPTSGFETTSIPTSTMGLSYASVVATNAASVAPGNSGQPVQKDFSDIMRLLSNDKNSKVSTEDASRHLMGLLEVEPLHFTCHATSDATRMERLSTGSSPASNSSSNLPSTIAKYYSSLEGKLKLIKQQHKKYPAEDNTKETHSAKYHPLLSEIEQKLTEPPKNSQTATLYPPFQFIPPTPKNTPFFMTPPVTPPNENSSLYVGATQDPGKPPSGKDSASAAKLPSGEVGPEKRLPVMYSQAHCLFQSPPSQALVIERMHAGARRFVVLDFEHPVLLTDVVIPACADLASISVDIWVAGEEVDGQRLVLSSDIGLRSLILSDIMPPPICQFLKGQRPASSVSSSPVDDPPAVAKEITCCPDQPRILSQLSCYMAILEDIQCRYSLACNRLTSLLAQTESANTSTAQHSFSKRSDVSTPKIHEAYQDCMQLQLQVNLARRAIERLRKALGLKDHEAERPQALARASTDKLRVLSELLLNTLLSITNPSFSIPQVPMSLYSVFTPQSAETLFRHLCIAGTRRMQLHTGVLLARVCGKHAWWGTFLGNLLCEFFSSDQGLMFPQDRVFLLITALGQKSLCSSVKTEPQSSATQVFESVLMLLARLLAPLIQDPGQNAVHLDLSLISWVLLFLSKCFDSLPPADESNREKDVTLFSIAAPASSRWDFIQGASALHSTWTTKTSSKLYRRKLHKRLIHHKQQLLDLQQTKKSTQWLMEKLYHNQPEMYPSVAASIQAKDIDVDATIKAQDFDFKLEFKQFCSKLRDTRHTFKDIIKNRKPREGSTNEHDSTTEGATAADEGCLNIAREKCIPVVRGLMMLLLSMDFSCHVDLFIIACKVVARISNLTRPAIMLSEMMKQNELESLLLLICSIECNHSSTSWGGAWAGHAITGLLQDILEGEKLYAMPTESHDVRAGHASTETDPTIGQSVTLPTMEEDSLASSQGASSAGASNTASQAADDSLSLDKESSLIMDMLLDDDEFDHLNKLHDYLVTDQMTPSSSFGVTGKPPGSGALGSSASSTAAPGGNDPASWMTISPNAIAWYPGAPAYGSVPSNLYDKKKLNMKALRNKLTNLVSKSGSSPQGVSTAIDARLETGVELRAETRLRTMLSLDVESIQSALSTPLPPASDGAASTHAYSSTDDQQLNDMSLLSSALPQPLQLSTEMLSICFNHLFVQLQMHRVNTEALLTAWLTFSDEATQDDAACSFDCSSVPSIALSPVAVTSLLNALVLQPAVSLKTWVLAFQVLTLMCNLRCDDDDKWLASVMVSDHNLMRILAKFLSSPLVQGASLSSQTFTQIGPTAVKAFHDFLQRLHIRCAEDNESHLKEMLLKLVYSLTSDRGAFQSCLGPVDAQCKLLECMLEQDIESVDVNNAISVIEAIVLLVNQHLSCQEQVLCHSWTEASVLSNSRACFTSLVPQLDESKSLGEASRNQLMSSLLKLINKLIQIPMPTRSGGGGGMEEADLSNRSLTDLSKMSQSLGTPGLGMTSTPNMPSATSQSALSQSRTDEQKQQDESKAPTLNLAQRPLHSCCHTEDKSQTLLCNVILGHQQIMASLLQTLSLCHGGLSKNKMLMDQLTSIDPISVGDGVFQILCTLNRRATSLQHLLQPLHQFLASDYRGIRMPGANRLSEPLLCFVLHVLDCPNAVRTFLEMGGVDAVCQNLVNTHRRVINTQPSMISTIMQYLMSKPEATQPVATAAKKTPVVGTDGNEGLQNFAPVGTISSSSPTACPADLLLNASPPHRRARSAAWSYKFYPDEAWIDLTISLPCAILLKEVRIQPHQTSLSTCPSAVSLELSCDNSAMVPACLPVVTSGLSSVNIQLLKPEVVTSVTVRLHRPRDTLTIGLSQLLLLGTTAFGEHANQQIVNEDYVAQTSIVWLRLLHHCLTQCPDLSPEVTESASQSQFLLPTLSSLLMSPSASIYAASIEAVLLKIGLHSSSMGLSLIEHLLRSRAGMDCHSLVPFQNKLRGMANESSVDILFQLGTHQDAATVHRLHAILAWLSDSATLAVQRSCAGAGLHERTIDLPSPAPAHIHCIASILWHSRDLATFDLNQVISKDLLSVLYEWSIGLSPSSLLKRAVDWVMCSLCFIQPSSFSTLMNLSGILLPVAITDDHKDQAALTDDHKADDPSALSLHLELSSSALSESHLSMLAVTCQSPEALRLLLDSGFVAVLCQAIYEFCLAQVEALRSPSSSSSSSSSSPDESGLRLEPCHLAPVLLFLAEVAKEVEMKSWLASAEGSAFWAILLKMLCASPSTVAYPELDDKRMSQSQRSAIESATVEFFCSVLACHPVSQVQFASVLCDVIRGSGQPRQGLSGFMRRLFLQVLLEDDKILVEFKNNCQMTKNGEHGATVLHPRYGTGHKHHSINLSLQTNCAEALAKVTTAYGMYSQPLGIPAAKDDGRKESAQQGIEVVDQLFSLAGMQAKEKRDKAKMPGRPVSRRGHRSEAASRTLIPSRMDLCFSHALFPRQILPKDLTLSQLMGLLQHRGVAAGQASLQLTISLAKKRPRASAADLAVSQDHDEAEEFESIPNEVLTEAASLPSALQVFASVGGLALLARHLPTFYPEVTRQVMPSEGGSKEGNLSTDWVTVESEDIYEDYDSQPSDSSSTLKQNLAMPPSIPPHSLVAFGLFLRLPGYAEVLLKEKRRAQCLLRLVLGVTDDGEGAHILTSPIASSLPTLPFNVLQSLFDSMPLTTDDGVLLRRMALEIGAVHLVLACLSVLSHHAPRQPIPGFHQEIILSATQAALSAASGSQSNPRSFQPGTTAMSAVDDKSQNYWAKGTGFGTGSTASSWDAEQALLRQRSEEEHVTCLLQVLASYIHPGGHGSSQEQLPSLLAQLLSHSCLVPAISSYLRNDSVLDMARHVPLYRSLLELLRGLAACTPLVPLLLPLPELSASDSSCSEASTASSVSFLLEKMKMCVDTYASRLKGKSSKDKNKGDSDEESEGLAKLIPDIQETAAIVNAAVTRLQQQQQQESSQSGDKEKSPAVEPSVSRLNRSDEERYMGVMRELQFGMGYELHGRCSMLLFCSDTFEMVLDDDNGTTKFTVPHHYESQVKAVGEVNNAARARRLAQEAVTLSTSLPLSASSSVFVRCDEERLDVMKVLITGPSDTPYANGCFEFDVYFPQDYPNSPPLVNLVTTGNQTVRFNPNLYNDGKVCLSILNTWHGRPEEKWNSHTSSFLQVLVSIQSLILVSEPYFNEPGYERSRGTPSGIASSKEYDANIRQATVKWGMLEMLKNPVSCFRDVILRHFWLKRNEIISDIQAWIIDLDDNSSDKRVGRTITHSCLALKRHYKHLLEEFRRMKPMHDMEESQAEQGHPSLEPSSSSQAIAASTEEIDKNIMHELMQMDTQHNFVIESSSCETSESSSVTCESSEDQTISPSDEKKSPPPPPPPPPPPQTDALQ
ncbi:hypothetical protein CAPTEDRAFT_223860 [Capitella teleta]|uniref:Dual E2 ubiquitin-conjugating enzyme/E3 ubiquitin-protein ligase BIRC6 n=1 Tax=Capitella teleta TaxID=283909 RepID=R7TJ74_CAPTE|nr:hypothetical protein CAPTEDRAFT_223860 [Capitella teleta]|eukprot:ELT93547.1 hypothetical protein CAPTEDRAFT_223860 [Capitella teleta]